MQLFVIESPYGSIAVKFNVRILIGDVTVRNFFRLEKVHQYAKNDRLLWNKTWFLTALFRVDLYKKNLVINFSICPDLALSLILFWFEAEFKQFIILMNKK